MIIGKKEFDVKNETYVMGILNVTPDSFSDGGKYNGGLKKYRYDGWGVGGGFSYGYQWIIGKHWNLETELGIGYAYLKYDKYLRNRCGRFIDTGHRNYWGPTKLSISFMYLFKSRQK